MVLIGRRLSAEDLQALLDDPDLAGRLLFGDLDESDDGDDPDGPEPELDLDKSWHGIHYLLTGTAWEIRPGAASAILGGEPIGDDVGYGPPRLLSPDEVRAVDADLRFVDVEALRAGFDPRALAAADIYPQIWDEGRSVFDEYLEPHLKYLREFYRTAAAGNEAVLLALT